MSELLVLIGLQASGKSTFAKQLAKHGWTRINYDDLQIELFGEGRRFNHKREAEMKRVALLRAETALMGGRQVVIDNTNLAESARSRWQQLAERCHAHYQEQRLDVPIEECIVRDRGREGSARVGRAVIEKTALFNGLLNFTDRKQYPRDFIIVDMDGTLADCEWRRRKAAKPLTEHKMVGVTPFSAPAVGCPNTGLQFEPQESCPACGAKPKLNHGIFYQDCDQDPVIWPIMHLVKKLSQDHDVLVVSGRPMNLAGKNTEKWLEVNATFPYRHLLMRNGGDYRPDYEIKEEILNQLISRGLELSRIKYIIDDRDQVVKMWRKHGLTCLQVADGDF